MLVVTKLQMHPLYRNTPTYLKVLFTIGREENAISWHLQQIRNFESGRVCRRGLLMATTTVYNRKDFFTFPKDQLLDYIEQQNEQLARFETRFRGK